jgi:hypothetical protein
MHLIEREDLRYHDYEWHALAIDEAASIPVSGVTFNRRHGYEVVDLLNELTGSGGSDLPLKTRLVCEWLIHEKLPTDVVERSQVIDWIVAHFAKLAVDFPG